MGIMLYALERRREEYDVHYEHAGYERVVSHLLTGEDHPLCVQESR